MIGEIKEDDDNELRKEEIDLIGSELDKEMEDLKEDMKNEKCSKRRKEIGVKRSKMKK